MSSTKHNRANPSKKKKRVGSCKSRVLSLEEKEVPRQNDKDFDDAMKRMYEKFIQENPL